MTISAAASPITSDKADLATILAACGDVAYTWNLTSGQIEWQGAVGAFFSNPAIIHNEQSFLLLVHPEDVRARKAAMAHHISSGEAYEGEYRLRHGEGYVWVQERGSALIGEDGKATHFLGVLRDIDERKQTEGAARHSAFFDSVTGQYNRSRLMDSVNEQLLQTRRYHSSACYVAIGVDYDVYGDPERDEVISDTVLITASQMIETILRASDIIGRVGAREFGVLLTSCPPGHLGAVAQKLLSQFKNFEVETSFGMIPAQISIGGVTLPGCAQTGFDIMRYAESALMDARLHGHESFREFSWSAEQIAEYEECRPIGEKVMRAMQQNRIEFAFQPIVNAGTHSISFYEALLRLWDDDGTLIAAKDFIPAAEQMGLWRAIDRRTLDLAINELVRNEEVILALNISGLTVADPAWLRRLNYLLQGRHTLARRLIIEITETMAMKDMGQSIQFVNHVRALGCRVALDDFGVGFTTFRHLKALTVDILKIDGAFIRDLQNKENQLFVRTLIEMAHAFKLETVAEFVETEEAVKFLKDEGVSFLQGYYFGKPDLNPPFRTASSAS